MHVKQTPEMKVLKPAHTIHLTENAQFYTLILGPETTVFGQNDSIMSFYKTFYRTAEQIKQAEEDEAREKEAQALREK